MKQPESLNPDQKVVVIGAGPAGLTAAYELTKYNIRPLVFEKLDKVGGIARNLVFYSRTSLPTPLVT